MPLLYASIVPYYTIGSKMHTSFEKKSKGKFRNYFKNFRQKTIEDIIEYVHFTIKSKNDCKPTYRDIADLDRHRSTSFLLIAEMSFHSRES